MARMTRRSRAAYRTTRGGHAVTRPFVLALACLLLAAASLGSAAWAGSQHSTSPAGMTSSPDSLLAPLPDGAFSSGARAVKVTAEALPTITKQPADVTVAEGGNAVFESTASGTPKPTVQWERSTNGGSTWSPLSGATSTTLTITGVNFISDGFKYRAVFKNSAGTATSNAATLHVLRAPVITQQPSSQAVAEGEPASFSAAASGKPSPTVQWELSTDGGATWTEVPGATSTTLAIASTTLAESGHKYRAMFTNEVGKTPTSAATLIVGQKPAITQQPEPLTVEEGESASFEAAASGIPTPTVQWEVSSNGGATWSAVSGATSNQLVIASTTTSQNGNEYRATFTNALGKATSEAATLTVHKAPVVTKQPVNQKLDEGESATFEASASGFPAPTVQWEVSTDGGEHWSNIEGATSSKLTIPSTTTAQSGYEYRAVFTNAAGTATSEPATLTVVAPPAITDQPASTTVLAGETALFEAAASGVPTPTVQWEMSTNGGITWSAIAGAEATQLSIPGAKESQSGNEYRAVFKNEAGTATTNAARLTVASTKFDAVAWGQNTFGQLGDGTIEESNSPVPVNGLHFVTSVAAGKRFSLALLADGTVRAWGSNVSGQLGNGSNTTSHVPVEVLGLSAVKSISAGGAFGLALLASGEVKSWGENESGQLGTGDTNERTVPVAVKTLKNVKSVSAGADHALALLSNGTVMAWGNNELGQLGTGNTKSSDVPVAVKGLSGVAAVAAGGNFSVAVLSNGTVEAWGSDEVGQLGVLPPEEGFSDVPVQVSSLSDITAVAAGANHALALTGSGTVMAWGDDSLGELGNGKVGGSQETPVEVGGLTGVQAISAGSQDSAALLGNGTLMTWGVNKFGTLGDGTSGEPSGVPVNVNGITKVASVSAGGTQMLAYGEPIPTVTGVSPNVGPTTGGTTVAITGVNLAGATSVKFGANAVTPVNVTSTGLEATAPAGTGTVDITVTTPAGTSNPVSADHFTYEAVPAITKLSLKSGPSTGGTSVTVTGTELAGVSGVKFGSVSASTFTVVSATSITVMSPPSIGGMVDVTVSNLAGTSAITSKDHFKYTPVVEGVAPATGSVLGGTSVTITGNGFAPGSGTTIFRFGKKKATGVVCESSTSCTMTTPAGAGTVDVTAQVGKAKGAVKAPADQFTYS